MSLIKRLQDQGLILLNVGKICDGKVCDNAAYSFTSLKIERLYITVWDLYHHIIHGCHHVMGLKTLKGISLKQTYETTTYLYSV